MLIVGSARWNWRDSGAIRVGRWRPDRPCRYGAQLASRCPRTAYHELAGLGHFLLVEDPAAVAAKIEDFVGA